MAPQNFVKMNEGSLKDNYQIGKPLGEGGFGEVRYCRSKTTKEARAVKFIHKNRLSEDDKSMIMNEVAVLGQMDHPNIVRLYEFYEEANVYCIVQEICTGGELFDQIIKTGRFKENKARVLIKRLLSVINYCHQKGIVHRDLKPENILLEPDSDFGSMKVIDFGTACQYDKNGHRRLNEMLGTPYYIAPEVLSGRYNEKCDIWSIGVITFMLLSGKAPFFGNDDEAIFQMVREGKFQFSQPSWKMCSKDSRDFITRCLDKDFLKRPTAQQCLDHTWIA